MTDGFPDSPRKVVPAAAHLGEQMVRQAKQAKYVGAEGALADEAEASATEAAADQPTAEPPEAPKAAEVPKMDEGEPDTPAPDTGGSQPPDSQHDPPSG